MLPGASVTITCAVYSPLGNRKGHGHRPAVNRDICATGKKTISCRTTFEEMSRLRGKVKQKHRDIDLSHMDDLTRAPDG